MNRTCLLACLLPLPCLLAAQFALTPAQPAVTDRAGASLPLAWLGGLNAPQWMTTDLDGDGIDDLYLFDRAGDAQVALQGDGAGDYVPAPELTAGFPDDLTGWVILRDYDGDGTDDLFTYSAANDGLRIFRGLRDGDNLLTFPPTPTYAGIRYPFNNGTIPLFITNIDYPAVDDIDGDGDLDILTFSVAGGYVEYFRNQSVERGFGRDTLIYTLEEECWGGFFESGLTTALDLASGPGQCALTLHPGTPVESRHSGSTVLTLDYDGDGVKDIMLGDISFEYLVLGYNGGTPERAYIDAQDPTWNSDGVVANIPFFPGAYHLDIDGDGARDLVASPSQTLNAEDVNVGWYYRNVGTDAAPDFVFRDSQLLVRQSLDFGTGSRPAAFDYDADGRPDLVVGNAEDYSQDNRINSRLRLLRNVTPPGGAPAFELADDDFLGLSQYQSTFSGFAPAFGDLDGDGDVDAVIGERRGGLIYLENTAGPGRPATFAAPVFDFQGLDAGQQSTPYLADLNRDGLMDLVVGGYDGRIRFFRNTGSQGFPAFDADPKAAVNIEQLGGINTNRPGFSTGYPSPVVLPYEDDFLLVTGNRAGTLEAYRFSDYTVPFTALSDTVAGLDVGGYSAPAVADFDGDAQVDFVLGNQRGGVTYYRSDLPARATTGVFGPPRPADFRFSLAPNPTAGLIYLADLPGTRVQRIRVIGAAGRVVREYRAAGRSSFTADLTGVLPGVYTVQVEAATGLAAQRLIVTR
ncbi:T9SS type A sorting domain-containing protein [Lewinella sp. IMCC34183]|uniref:T9SS type A sorting domain-containing protein n=1 Tax=Lewinella sp. IMCC34183 TaxID=2248762 RepID=UPI000E226EEC|nr:T9SS type A sorting domain-containing protein [Lewinella sp. IMCC34183]